MNTLILRFRDLTIPDGDSIRRHSAKIDEYGEVWWGWIMRGHEQVPKQLFADLVSEVDVSPKGVYLFHTTERKLYPATLADVSAFPGGDRIQTPEVQKTPSYMAEAELSAWFKLTSIEDAIQPPFTIAVKSLPTLAQITKPVDIALLERPTDDLTELFMSTATLWEAEVRPAQC